MSFTANQKILALHSRYCELTGMSIRLDYHRESQWAIWCKWGFTESDLVHVVMDIRRGIKEGRRFAGALKFSNLIGNPDHFEETLAEAKARAREKKGRSVSPRENVLRQTGRTEGTKDTSKPIGEIISKEKVNNFLTDLRNSIDT